MKQILNVKPAAAPAIPGEVITLPPVQVRRRVPPAGRVLRNIAERTVPAVLGL